MATSFPFFPGPSWRLVVAEDDRLIAADLEDCLRQLGHRVVAVQATGVGALAVCRLLRPDVLLLNVRLRGPLGGLALARRLRAAHPTQPALLFFTAQTDPATLAEAAALGALAVLPKPLGGAALCAALRQALARP